MTTEKLYERDFYAWTAETAEVLRQRRFRDLDLENLIEEVKSLGRSERRELESRLRTLMQHLLYVAYLTRDPQAEGWGWKATVEEQRAELEDLLRDNPSLKRGLEEMMRTAYRRAIAIFLKKAVELERPVREADLPPGCPWTFEELLTGDRYFSRQELERR